MTTSVARCERGAPGYPIYIEFGEVLLGETNLFVDDGDLQLDLSAELEPYRCAGRRATIGGTAGRDTLVGTPGADVIAGLQGKDKIKGLAGKDRICGGRGRDKLKGGPGKDTLKGGSGKDKLDGGPGKDKEIQ
jgi:Ca2+-binding RTX toxin-like protein